MKRFLIVLMLGVFLCGCASIYPVERGRLTAGMVKKEIIKEVTTQNDILEVFGVPNIITKNKSGKEVWTYDKVSVEKGVSDVYTVGDGSHCPIIHPHKSLQTHHYLIKIC